MSGKCLCGAKAVATAYLPVSNIYNKSKTVTESHAVTEPHAVCDYHANKAREQGFKVVPD